MYEVLLNKIGKRDYEVLPFRDYLERKPQARCIILRHDVDKIPSNALICAGIEKSMNIRSTYYFRVVKESFNPGIIREIANMGHEIGYHYEDLVMAKGDMAEAIKLFTDHLAGMRKVADIKTICMHGNPLSRWDNLRLWDTYSYKDFKITGEPFLDLDFSQVYYLTDTGRRWDAFKSNVRDKVNTHFQYPISKTRDMIRFLEEDLLPDTIMLNMHPQRWNDRYISWIKELIFQNAKNQIKKLLSQ